MILSGAETSIHPYPLYRPPEILCFKNLFVTKAGQTHPGYLVANQDMEYEAGCVNTGLSLLRPFQLFLYPSCTEKSLTFRLLFPKGKP